jgi:hypothetical protein
MLEGIISNAMERLLYRLSQTPHRTRCNLEGALMLHVWTPRWRATKDIDPLGSLDSLKSVTGAVCDADVEPDGMIARARASGQGFKQRGSPEGPWTVAT